MTIPGPFAKKRRSLDLRDQQCSLFHVSEQFAVPFSKPAVDIIEFAAIPGLKKQRHLAPHARMRPPIYYRS